ncbi:MAG TPA: WecB/TagA/CpsF family glycosyltransferase, partial [Candidatus Obscuribacter sp.]|nr:WecB/TagA/CpsF family glycosyltransferase [Candidatus Obscuribacter sp.]
MNTNVSSNNCQTINRAFVLGYPVDLVDMPTAISLMEGFWQSKCGMHVVTLNAEMTMQSINNKELGDIIKKADLVVPDGAGVVLSLKNRGGLCAQAGRLPGIELAQKALESAAARGEKVALLGGRPEVMEKLKQILPQKHPGLNVVAYQNG